jgi:hypothetical protein
MQTTKPERAAAASVFERVPRYTNPVIASDSGFQPCSTTTSQHPCSVPPAAKSLKSHSTQTSANCGGTTFMSVTLSLTDRLRNRSDQSWRPISQGRSGPSGLVLITAAVPYCAHVFMCATADSWASLLLHRAMGFSRVATHRATRNGRYSLIRFEQLSTTEPSDHRLHAAAGAAVRRKTGHRGSFRVSDGSRTLHEDGRF